MKIAIIFNDRKISGMLTRIFTGCYAYHIAWVDEEGGVMYDMHWLRRCRPWPRYKDGQVLLFDGFPEVTREYLEYQWKTDETQYGWRDYLLFTLRPLYHLFGKSTRNVGGIVCSGMVNIDVWNCGGSTPWPIEKEEPSPCDWFNWLRINAAQGVTHGMVGRRSTDAESV